MPLPCLEATTTLHGATYPAGGDNHTLSRPAGTLSREAGEGKIPFAVRRDKYLRDKHPRRGA